MSLPQEAKDLAMATIKQAALNDNEMVLELAMGAIWELGHNQALIGVPIEDCPWMRMPDDLTGW